MDEERLARLEQLFGEIEAEWAAHEHAITALALTLRDMDATTVERVHHDIMAAAVLERRRRGERAERRAIATEVLADKLLRLCRRAPPRDGPGQSAAS